MPSCMQGRLESGDKERRSPTFRPWCASFPAMALSSVDLPALGGPSSSVRRPGTMRLLMWLSTTIFTLRTRRMCIRSATHCAHAHALISCAARGTLRHLQNALYKSL